MSTLRPLDSLVIDVLLDNLTDSYSTKPPNVSPEFKNVIDAGATELSGKTLCCAQLGLSVMLTAHAGERRHKLLFDAGPEGEIFVRNCKNLGVALDDVEEVAVSHGHWDHMGAMLPALKEITNNGKRKVKVHVNSGMFFERGALLSDGRVAHFENVPDPETMTKHGADVVNDDNERFLLDEFFFLSGEIPRVTSFEKGRMDHMARETPEKEWQPDPLLMDERYLACNVKDKGLIVFSSCSHAGIVNVLFALRDRFPEISIYGVFGGLHLVGTLEKIIPDTINGIKEFKPKQIMPAHCTGFRAHYALLEAFGESIVTPSAVGSRYHI
ncbi:MAG TPA: MBL fold metallo-hydrolase [Planktothrix sp.]|jgi:7,8-dihydropterin-6-yl-methyl-4-(beta-D-ribofuranosyl)aminobenzene 5'-phosphate synthase